MSGVSGTGSKTGDGMPGVSLPVDFTKCCKDSGFLMVVKCRKENSALKECLIAHYTNPDFYEECKMEYLKEREEFRKTGISTKNRLQKLPTSM
ncbi:COX assembly mitochondrial protein homolog isoform X2 [Macrotis lagotis]|uniref:COX assembly mitochondrial protein homolog isoform X2 n=1 Tax=Macrotis lagotis TaxID=92651 RepID=UPI003D69874C